MTSIDRHEDLGITDADICSWFSVLGSAQIKNIHPLKVVEIKLNAPLKILITTPTAIDPHPSGFFIHNQIFIGSTVALYEIIGKESEVGGKQIFSIYPVLTLRLPWYWFGGYIHLRRIGKAKKLNGIPPLTFDGNGNFAITDIKKWHKDVSEAFALHLLNYGIRILEEDKWQFTTETK